VIPLNSTVATPTDRDFPTNPNIRRAALALVLSIVLLPLLIAGFFIAIDPYYLFGSPSWRGFNLVRPYYEPYVVSVKPYQVWRLRPSAVVLGASSAEVGIDPRHAGWNEANVFNFSLPSSNSYAIMLAFLHAQKVAPLKQAIVNLDFFSYNIHLRVGPVEQRFAQGVSADFAGFLDETLPDRRKSAHRITRAAPVSTAESNWNEALYLAVNEDVAAAVARHDFKSGREHYELAGRAERREGAAVPADWHEGSYLQAQPDVAAAVAKGDFVSGYHHYLRAGRVEARPGGFLPKDWDEEGYLQVHPDVAAAVAKGSYVRGYNHYLAAGRAEGRLGGFLPKDWDEAGYLAANPDAHNLVALGVYRNGFIHYAALGRELGLLGGLPPANAIEKLRQRWPGVDQPIFRIRELAHFAFSMTAMRDAISTIFRQAEPAEFNDAGMRVWHGHEEIVRKLGGVGKIIRTGLARGGGRPWLAYPKLQHCFTNTDTGVSTFDPFRFMVRRAYAEGTDLRLFTTPLNAAIYQFFQGAGLFERYEFWLKELVRINEEEAARAGRDPLPLWHFGYVNTITSEPIPEEGDMTPMRWSWDYAHYRKEAGDLMLDRIFDYRDSTRALPDDFGTRLTGQNVDAHLARSRSKLAEWVAANQDFASQIVAAAKSPKAPNRQAEATCW
jgi:hypothetical protein